MPNRGKGKRPRRRVPPPPTEWDFDLDTGEPFEYEIIPEALTGAAWDRFFRAVRMRLAARSEGMLKAWDDAACALMEEQREDDAEAIAEALDRLCKILENPEAAAKSPRFRPGYHGLYKETQAVIKHCRTLRQRYPKQAICYPPRDPNAFLLDFYKGGPLSTPVRPDAPEFYRLALREVYGLWRVPDAVLTDCVTHHWRKPAAFALEVLAAYAGLSTEYLKRKLYQTPRSRPA